MPVAACGALLAPILQLQVLLQAPMLLPADAVQAEPVLEAAARRLVEPRSRCLSLRCRGHEWRPLAPVVFEDEPRMPPVLPGARSAIGLRAPATPRDSTVLYSNDWRIGSRHAVQLLRDGDTRLGVQFGAGYRLAPLHDDGVRMPGPVVRSELSFARDLGARAQWRQRVLVESGRGDVFVRQAFALDIELWPAWMLETDYVLRRDAGGGSGEGSIRVLRRF